MRAGDNLKWFEHGEEVPPGSRLIAREIRTVAWDYESTADLHFLQTPNLIPIEKTFYLYELPAEEGELIGYIIRSPGKDSTPMDPFVYAMGDNPDELKRKYYEGFNPVFKVVRY